MRSALPSPPARLASLRYRARYCPPSPSYPPLPSTDPGNRAGEPIELGLSIQLSDADQQRVAKLGPIAAERDAAQDSGALCSRERRGRVTCVHHELVEERRAEARTYPGGRERRGSAIPPLSLPRAPLPHPPPPPHPPPH